MVKLIEKINLMFDFNPYTDEGRVIVDYAPNMHIVVINVMGKTEMVDINDLTEYGAMYAILDKVREMYDKR